MNQFEVMVVGAGPAGIAAATAAARCGARVAVLDDNAAPGGQIWRAGAETIGPREVAVRRLAASGARVLSGWRVYDAPETGVLRAICESTESGEAEVRTCGYERLVLATGARERFLPFPGWTLPGVFGPGGLQALVKGGFDVKGKRVVVAGSGPLLLAVAAHLRGYGAKVVSVAEQAAAGRLLPFAAGLWAQPGKLVEGVKYRAALGMVPFRTGTWPVAALADASSGRLCGVELTDGSRTWTEHCDLLACGFHLVPNTELAALLGCRMEDGFVAADGRQQTSVANVFCAGEPTGIGGLDAALVQGEVAGLACAGRSTDALNTRNAAGKRFARRLARAFALREELRTLARSETIVCRCEDVTFGALVGRKEWTEAKLQTRCGMGPCQGRVCGAATEVLFGWTAKSVRPPLTPVPVSALLVETSDSGS